MRCVHFALAAASMFAATQAHSADNIDFSGPSTSSCVTNGSFQAAVAPCGTYAEDGFVFSFMDEPGFYGIQVWSQSGLEFRITSITFAGALDSRVQSRMYFGSVPGGFSNFSYPPGTYSTDGPADGVKYQFASSQPFSIDNITIEVAPVTAVPEPSTAGLMGVMLLGLVAISLRRRRATDKRAPD